jgi:FHA domain-containing protein
MTEERPTDRLRLKAVAGPAAGAEIEVRDELLLGRHAPEPGRLEGDPEISREHARIERRDSGDYFVTDLGSRNGTLVNGRDIKEPTVLSVGDKIEVGQTTLVVQYTAPPPPPADDQIAPPGFAPTKIAPVQPEPGPPEPEPAPPEPEPEPPEPEPEPPEPEPEPPEPEPAPPEPAAAPVPEPLGRLSVHVEVDPESREARLELGDDSEPILLRWEDGRWQIARPG